YDTENSAALFPRATRCSLHHTKIAAGADRKPGLGQARTDLHCLTIFFGVLATLGTAKNRYDSVTCRFYHVNYASAPSLYPASPVRQTGQIRTASSGVRLPASCIAFSVFVKNSIRLPITKNAIRATIAGR